MNFNLENTTIVKSDLKYGLWVLRDRETGQEYYLKRCSSVQRAIMPRVSQEIERDSGWAHFDFPKVGVVGVDTIILPAIVEDQSRLWGQHASRGKRQQATIVTTALPMRGWSRDFPCNIGSVLMSDGYQAIRNHPMDVEYLTDLFDDFCRLNDKGIIHSDLPSNVHVERKADGAIRFGVIDFDPGIDDSSRRYDDLCHINNMLEAGIVKKRVTSRQTEFGPKDVVLTDEQHMLIKEIGLMMRVVHEMRMDKIAPYPPSFFMNPQKIETWSVQKAIEEQDPEHWRKAGEVVRHIGLKADVFAQSGQAKISAEDMLKIEQAVQNFGGLRELAKQVDGITQYFATKINDGQYVHPWIKTAKFPILTTSGGDHAAKLFAPLSEAATVITENSSLQTMWRRVSQTFAVWTPMTTVRNFVAKSFALHGRPAAK